MTEDTKTAAGSRFLAPGSKSWFWGMRLKNYLFFALPLGGAAVAVFSFIRPRSSVELNDAQTKALSEGYELPGDLVGRVTSVNVRLTEPDLLDRLYGSVPTLLIAVAMAYVFHALWRIEINMTADQRPYTDKDAATFKRAAKVFIIGLFSAIVSLYALGWIKNGYGNAFDGADAGLVVVLTAGIVVMALLDVTRRMYLKGRQSYEELEKGV